MYKSQISNFFSIMNKAHVLQQLLALITCSFFLISCANLNSLNQKIKLERPLIKTPGPEYSENLAAAYQYYYLPGATPRMSNNMRDFFYLRAKSALDGNTVNPVVVPSIPEKPDIRAHIISGRETLAHHLNREHRPADTPILAQAQAAFDCQVLMELAPDRQGNAQICRKRFENLIARLEKPLWPKLEYHVFFQPGRSVLKREAIETLKNIANIKKKDPYAHLKIVGNTDPSGREAANQRLSMQRARAVRNILLQFGVKEKEIKVMDSDTDSPAFFSLPEDGNIDRQRRVSILVERQLVETPSL